jgi:hypothetical protein
MSPSKSSHVLSLACKSFAAATLNGNVKPAKAPVSHQSLGKNVMFVREEIFAVAFH